MASKATSKAGPPRADNNALHVSVLLEECVNLLGPALTAEAPVMIDAMLGMGGHSFVFLERFANLTVIGIDQDPEAIELAGERLTCFGKRFATVRVTYDDVPDVAARYGRAGWAGAVPMDLGISSFQLDDEGRGFSYPGDGLLDMQMDKTDDPTAADALASADKAELTRILREYGEERFASRIAARILAAHVAGPIERTGQLADVVRDAIPAPARHMGGSPCKRTLQAPRIVVNDELALLRHAIPRTIEAIVVGGRTVVEPYRSLEDKIAEREMTKGMTSSTPAGPSVGLDDRAPYFRLLTRGAVKADATELQANSRSASVRLRAAERLRGTLHTA